MFFHEPVLLQESIKFLITNKAGIYCDATLGHGGHALEILKNISNKGILIGIDQDPESIKIASQRLKKNNSNYLIVHQNFVHLNKIFQDHQISQVDGIIFDLGYSRTQIKNPQRGFSYKLNGPLDMRMNLNQKEDAQFILREYDVEELEWIFVNYGEVRYGKVLAQAIVHHREIKNIETTGELLEIIKKVVPKLFFKNKNPSRQVFQALRIAVNNELEFLKSALVQSIQNLKKNGRLVVISYHSLEDKIVKQIISELNQIKIINKNKIIKPTQSEILANPSARSAKMRIFQK